MFKGYIDPGIGSLVAQVVVGGILSVLFFFKGLGKKIRQFFKSDDNKDS